MWRRTMIVALILGGALALMACEVQFNVGGSATQVPLPTLVPTAPPMTNNSDPGQLATEAIIGGMVRLYCQSGCQAETVFPFRDMLFYSDYEALLSEMGELGRVTLAWFPESQPAQGGAPVNGILYIAQPPDSEAPLANYEVWREFLITVQGYLPPVTSNEPPTANLSVIEGPLQNVTEIHGFTSGEDGEESLANLLTTMGEQTPEQEQGDAPSTTKPHPFDVAQAQFLLRRSGAEDRLVILLKETEPPDSPRACFESISWLNWLLYCTSFW